MIVVFGSLNMDVLMRVPRHPRPGETLPGEGCVLCAGGKGANQAVAAARVGAMVMMFGAVGRDLFGDALLRNLAERGVDATGVRIVDKMTGCATITIDAAGENAICVALGANAEAVSEQVPDDVLVPGNTIVLQMEVRSDENWRLLERAFRGGARTILNLAPATGLDDVFFNSARQWLDLLIVNKSEARSLLDHIGAPSGKPEDDGIRLSQALETSVVLTLGPDGAIGIARGEVIIVPSLPVDVRDTTGAGDTFAGVLATALDSGEGLKAALRRASVAGSLACTKFGAQEAMPSNEQLEAVLRLHPIECSKTDV